MLPDREYIDGIKQILERYNQTLIEVGRLEDVLILNPSADTFGCITRKKLDSLRKALPSLVSLVMRGEWRKTRSVVLLWCVYWLSRPIAAIDIEAARKSVAEKR